MPSSGKRRDGGEAPSKVEEAEAALRAAYRQVEKQSPSDDLLKAAQGQARRSDHRS